MKPYQDPFARATGWLTTAADQVAAIKTMNAAECEVVLGMGRVGKTVISAAERRLRALKRQEQREARATA